MGKAIEKVLYGMAQMTGNLKNLSIRWRHRKKGQLENSGKIKVVQESHGPNIKKSTQIGIEGSRRQGKKMHWFPRRSKNLEDAGDMVKKTCYFLKEKKTKAIRNSRENFF